MQWRSVRESVPPEGDEVLVAYEFGGQWFYAIAVVKRFEGQKKRHWLAVHDGGLDVVGEEKRVRYWAPISEPPGGPSCTS